MVHHPDPIASLSPDADPVAVIMASLLPLHMASSIDWLADAVCTAAEHAIHASYTFLYLEGQDGKLERKLPASDVRRRALQRAVDAFGEDALAARLSPLRAPTIATALRDATPLVAPAPDVLRGLTEIEAAREAQEGLGARAMAVVPLESSGERVGALIAVCVERPTTDQLRMFGAHVASALVKLRQETAARERTVLDIVRSVFDARKIESELQKEIARAQRYRHEVSIVVVEATNVRLLQERFGSFLADQLVQRLGGVLAENARDIDVIGAFKESGYTMVLTQATSTAIGQVAERLLRIAQETRLDDDVPGLELHLVCGWATCPNDGITTEAMFAAAEARMYGTGRVLPFAS